MEFKMSEQELITLLQEDCEHGINILYDNYSSVLYGVIIKIAKSEEIAQDLLQETFVKIWKNFSSYDSSKGRLFTWIVNIARNETIDYIRSKGFKNKNLTDAHSDNIDLSENVSQINIDQIGLTDTLKVLNPKNRVVIDTVYLKGYTFTETAEHLDIPIGTVKTRVRNGLIELRKLIK